MKEDGGLCVWDKKNVLGCEMVGVKGVVWCGMVWRVWGVVWCGMVWDDVG